ncbi:MAG: LPS export ABC transporter permease LptF [Acidobacteria bacterium]|nr:LPS export ABC transporter permease LptF [Acidobacteriota bacterium]MBI3658436.1 LPS export ABC transporter permease LptF [Acidobacteriota bacterium]
MKKIDRYIISELLPPFLVCLLVFSFIVFAQELGRLVQLLISRDAGWPVALKLAFSILPRILIFTLPLSFLVGIIVGFSRLSSDSEIIALRASGFHLFYILRPAIILSLLVWLVSLSLSLYWLPLGNARLRALTYEIGMTQATSAIQPRVFTEDLPNTVLYIESLSENRSRWQNIFLADTGDKTDQKIILAQRGRLLMEPFTRKVQAHLENGLIYKVDMERSDKDNVSRFETTELPIASEDAPVQRPRERRTEELTIRQLWQHIRARTAQAREMQVELNLRLALAFSVWAFCLMGVPLGIFTRKGGRATGFVVGILLIMLFYILLFAGKRLAVAGTWSPVLGVWTADIVFFMLGLLLMVKSNQDLNIIRHISASHIWAGLRAQLAPWIAARRRRTAENAVPRTATSFQIMRVASLYVTRSFLGFFLLSLGACLALFIVFTLFELIDDIVRNNIPVLLMLLYFIYLTPQILVVVVPLSILLGALISYGILEKSNQMMAFKAGGISVYRLTAPVIIAALGISGVMYSIQEYVLPDANQRQDSLRHVIKGRPPQTTFRPERKWTFGDGNRIFNYAYFDPRQNRFGEFNLYEVDVTRQIIHRRIYGLRAQCESGRGWILEKGWVRDFGTDTFYRFEKEKFNFPESAEYFKEGLMDPKESSKMTYAELRDYIARLRRSGVDTAMLKMELYRKVSFPLSALVMVLLAIPFSFLIGKRGAFHGIAASVVIGIVYWGTMNLFEALGSYGLLSPLLAAWAPNILYSAVGLYSLFTIRT